MRKPLSPDWLINLAKPFASHARYSRAGFRCAASLPFRFSVGDPVVYQRLCLDGVAIAILPNWLATDAVAKKQLVPVLSQWIPDPIELYAIYPTRLSMTPKLNAFLRFMENASGQAHNLSV